MTCIGSMLILCVESIFCTTDLEQEWKFLIHCVQLGLNTAYTTFMFISHYERNSRGLSQMEWLEYIEEDGGIFGLVESR